MNDIKGTPNQGLAGATLGFFFGFAAVALFSPTAKNFQQMLNLSPVLLGLLVAVPSLSGSLLRIPFSAWVDTTGGRKPFLVLLLLSIIGMLGLFLVVQFLYPDRMNIHLYPLLLLLGALSGCGIATFSVGISQVAYWFPQKRQGYALGMFAGIGNLAPGIFSFILPFALSSLGLALSYFFWLVFLLVGTLLYHLLGRNAWYFQLKARGKAHAESVQLAKRRFGQEIFPSGRLLNSLLISMKIWRTWALVILYFTSFGGFIALTAWFPIYWTSFYDVSIVMAGSLTASYSILASLTRVGGGAVSDRLGGEKTALLALFTMFTGAIFMAFSQQFVLSILGSLLMAVGMGANNAAVFKLVPQEVPQAVGGAAGWVGGLGAFGGFIIPPVMGAFVKAHTIGYARGFVVFIALSVFSLAIAAVLRASKRKAGG
ncbi:MFS transporter [candidate division KSB1 bacterium RBG_16_48_16]|nr:MAG: MFS transporter [candidate division KSB1 bacterium RBG_16_48_16]